MTKNQIERVLIVPDVHAPYHDKKAFRLMLKVVESFDFHTCAMIGDFYDCYAVSSYAKDPGKIDSLEKELAVARRQCLEPLNAYPFKRKFVTLGNHEQRVETYLKLKAPEMYDEIMSKDVFGFKSSGWEVYKYREHTSIGRIIFTHDVGANGAEAVLNAVQDNVVTGHDHKITYVIRGTALGETHVSTTVGWLGDVNHADYISSLKAKRQWALGFGIGYYRVSNGFMYITPIPIIKNSCVVEGRLFML